VLLANVVRNEVGKRHRDCLGNVGLVPWIVLGVARVGLFVHEVGDRRFPTRKAIF